MEKFINDMAKDMLGKIKDRADLKVTAVALGITTVMYMFMACASMFLIVFMLKNITIVTSLFILIGIATFVTLLIMLCICFTAAGMVIDKFEEMKK